MLYIAERDRNYGALFHIVGMVLMYNYFPLLTKTAACAHCFTILRSIVYLIDDLSDIQNRNGSKRDRSLIYEIHHYVSIGVLSLIIMTSPEIIEKSLEAIIYIELSTIFFVFFDLSQGIMKFITGSAFTISFIVFRFYYFIPATMRIRSAVIALNPLFENVFWVIVTPFYIFNVYWLFSILNGWVRKVKKVCKRQ